ncbi:MAG: TIGR02594 family protein [Rhodocyclaceae bacterium]
MKPVIDAAQNMVPFIPLLRERGVRTVIRYYNHRNSTRLPTKRLEKAEAEALIDAGFDLAVAFQQTGGTKGAIGDLDQAHGQADAAQALKLAQELGQPEGSAIYFAVDHDYFRESELRAIEPYFAAVHSALAGKYRVGVYGSGAVGGRMVSKGFADLIWLAGAKGWSGTRDMLKTDRWALFQGDIDMVEPGAFSYDGNEVSPAHADFGQFRLGDADAAPGDTPAVVASASPKVLMEVRARDGLKLRPTASTEFPAKLSLPFGSIVSALSRNGDWVLVDLDGDGASDGFMHGDFLQVVAGGFPVTPATGDTPFDIARAELALGVAEVPGPGSNPRILLYHSHTTLKATSDEVAWCSAFMNYCVNMAGLVGTHSAGARSWHDKAWGRDVTNAPQPGDIVVFSRTGGGAPAGSGHVGFWVEADDASITVLGGNQSNRVRLQKYPKDGMLGTQKYKVLSVRRA